MNEVGPIRLTPKSHADPRWDLAQRVADSSYFRKSPKLRAFLLYVCENALLGRLDNLNAQLIGSRVFGRSPEYDLSEDAIVRVEARELRKRLEAYFAGEGRKEPVVIEIPKGTYAPVFKPREQAAPEGSETPASAAPERTEARRPRWLVPALVAALAVLAIVSGWLATDNWALRQQLPAIGGSGSDRFAGMYGDLLGALGATPNRETLVVLSNPGVVLYYGAEDDGPLRQAPDRTIRAPGELKKTFGFVLPKVDRTLPYHYLQQNRQDYTGMGEAVGAFHVARLMQALHRPVRLTQSRFLNWDQVQKQDLILLGGPSSNDWTYQDDASSNFTFVRGAVDNARPLPGESKRYQSDLSVPVGAPRTDYGVIKMLTSPYSFHTLVLAGMTSAGTAGVAEFLAAPDKMQLVYDRIRAAAAGKRFPPQWEVLIRIAVRGELPVETAILAVRPAAASR